MSEKAPSTPDLGYAEQLRVGWVRTVGDNATELRTPIDVGQVKAAEGGLTDGVRQQLDMIVTSVDSVNQNVHKLPGYSDAHLDALRSGYVLAGENKAGQVGKTEMRFASPEEFRAMVARAVGEQALKAYENELIGDNTSDVTVPRLISTVTNVESSDGAAAIQEPGELRSTFKPASAVEAPNDDALAPGKLISTFGNQESRKATEEEAVATESVPEEPAATVESEDDGWVSFEESNPLPLREAAAAAQAAETPIKVSETADVQEADQNIEVTTLRDVMQSPQAMLEAMNDSTLSPEVKQQLDSIVRSWNTLKAAKVADEVWQEAVLPRLKTLDESLPNFHNKARQVKERLGTLEEGLTLLSTATENGDIERMGNLARRYNFVPEYQEVAKSTRAVLESEKAGTVIRDLNLELLEGDDRIKRMRRSSSSEISPEEAEELFAIAGVAGSESVEDIKNALTQADTTKSLQKLRRRKDAIDAMIQYGRLTKNVAEQGNIEGAVRVMTNQFNELFSMGTRMTSSDISLVRAKMRRLLIDPMEQLEKFSRLTQLYKNEIK